MRPNMNAKVMCWIAGTALLVSVGLSLAVANGGEITGVVNDNSGKPAAGALVKVKNGERGLAVTVVSQDQGKYKISGLPSGQYTAQGFGGGFQGDSQAGVEVDGSRNATLDLALTFPQDFKKATTNSQAAQFMPDGEGKTIIVGVCTHCHHGPNILFARKTREEWKQTIEKMRTFGSATMENLALPGEQYGLVLDYLTKYFGPDSPPLDTSGKTPATWVKGAAAKSVVYEFDLPRGGASHDVAVDSKGNGWSLGAGVLGRLDPTTFTYTRIPMPEGEKGKFRGGIFAIDPHDRIWAGDNRNSRFVEYDPQTGEFSFYPYPEGPPGGAKNVNTIRFHPNGTVWATVITHNLILRLDPATKKVTEYPVPSGVLLKSNVNPYGMAIDTKEHFIWFAERHTSKVGKVNPVNGEVAELEVPTQYSNMRRMAADGEGNVWVAEYGNVGKLAMVDHRTGKVTEYPTPSQYSGAYSVDVDRKHNLIWVNEFMADKIARFDPRTKTFVEYILPTHYLQTRRIELDPTRSNRVWFSGTGADIVGFLDVIE